MPYDAVIKALQFSTRVLPDGQVELQSPGLVTRVDPKRVQTDPELGLVFSVQDLKTLFGVEAKFDLNEYAIQLQAPWLEQTNQAVSSIDTPIQLEGLPYIGSSTLSLAAIEQRVDVSGSQGTSTNARGELMAVGTLLGGSWFIRTDQPDLRNQRTWSLAEARFQRQTNQSDFIIGSQPPFWSSQGTNDYWGFTTIQRQGFVPQLQLYGEADPRQRLQAAQVGQTIVGRAEPGTLARLTQGFNSRLVTEVLVDSSGIYRFENVKVDNQFLSNYRVLLYPQGRLTAQPEIREATFSIVPGQLPAGASALVISAGFQREPLNFQAGKFLGNFSDFQGGIAQRWGLSQELTVGLGAVYDQSMRGLGELFFQPRGVPLRVAVSALTGGGDGSWDINANISFEPSRNFRAQFSSDQFSSRFNLDWQVIPGLTLLGIADSRDSVAAGLQIVSSSRTASTFARVTLDAKSRLRWSLFQRLGRLQLSQFGNEIGSRSELSYDFSPDNDFTTGHALVLGYETQNQNRSDKLLSLAWHYHSQQRSIDGNYLWQAELGYAVGTQGSGLIASVGTTIVPGLMVRARYQGVSVTSDQATFSLELVPSLNFQQGITAGDRHANYFRTQGGLLIQPFLDRNNNGRRDANEAFYTDPSLILLNNQPIQSLRPEILNDRISLRLPPNTYRLDFDPAGFPADWQVASNALAVEVVAGSHTPVLIPLVPSYTLAGTVTDPQGKPLGGVRVEAIQSDSKQRMFSVTNNAGVYYLERLQQGTYNLQVNGEPAQPDSIELEASSEKLQEVSLQYSRPKQTQ
ncbi:carboxypeptidase-like regulatory domain-containing protein [Leptolyngbya sp. FACHB-261]|uniref:carboxypeptidase-like regulatory domain-containing protein n=1 Tax=Leptolyngbya sp. FACHB-261 TaxID=2692806 RepID=UPI0018F05035|nr:carboxypeptidase-like regulatory domain-containing protein [Leptolyngbya sp. FACHB-261]